MAMVATDYLATLEKLTLQQVMSRLLSTQRAMYYFAAGMANGAIYFQ